jgi:hypothetical protein
VGHSFSLSSREWRLNTFKRLVSKIDTRKLGFFKGIHINNSLAHFLRDSSLGDFQNITAVLLPQNHQLSKALPLGFEALVGPHVTQLRISIDFNDNHQRIEQLMAHFARLEALELFITGDPAASARFIQGLPCLSSLSVGGDIDSTIFTVINEMKNRPETLGLVFPHQTLSPERQVIDTWWRDIKFFNFIKFPLSERSYAQQPVGLGFSGRYGVALNRCYYKKSLDGARCPLALFLEGSFKGGESHQMMLDYAATVLPNDESSKLYAAFWFLSGPVGAFGSEEVANHPWFTSPWLRACFQTEFSWIYDTFDKFFLFSEECSVLRDYLLGFHLPEFLCQFTSRLFSRVVSAANLENYVRRFKYIYSSSPDGLDSIVQIAGQSLDPDFIVRVGIALSKVHSSASAVFETLRDNTALLRTKIPKHGTRTLFRARMPDTDVINILCKPEVLRAFFGGAYTTLLLCRFQKPPVATPFQDHVFADERFAAAVRRFTRLEEISFVRCALALICLVPRTGTWAPFWSQLRTNLDSMTRADWREPIRSFLDSVPEGIIYFVEAGCPLPPMAVEEGLTSSPRAASDTILSTILSRDPTVLPRLDPGRAAAVLLYRFPISPTLGNLSAALIPILSLRQDIVLLCLKPMLQHFTSGVDGKLTEFLQLLQACLHFEKLATHISDNFPDFAAFDFDRGSEDPIGTVNFRETSVWNRALVLGSVKFLESLKRNFSRPSSLRFIPRRVCMDTIALVPANASVSLLETLFYSTECFRYRVKGPNDNLIHLESLILDTRTKDVTAILSNATIFDYTKIILTLMRTPSSKSVTTIEDYPTVLRFYEILPPAQVKYLLKSSAEAFGKLAHTLPTLEPSNREEGMELFRGIIRGHLDLLGARNNWDGLLSTAISVQKLISNVKITGFSTDFLSVATMVACFNLGNMDKAKKAAQSLDPELGPLHHFEYFRSADIWKRLKVSGAASSTSSSSTSTKPAVSQAQEGGKKKGKGISSTPNEGKTSNMGSTQTKSADGEPAQKQQQAPPQKRTDRRPATGKKVAVVSESKIDDSDLKEKQKSSTTSTVVPATPVAPSPAPSPASGVPKSRPPASVVFAACPICYDFFPDHVLFPCGHTYCSTCVTKLSVCSFCRIPVTNYIKMFLSQGEQD